MIPIQCHSKLCTNRTVLILHHIVCLLQLIQHTIASAAELFGSSVDTGLLAGLKTAAQEGDTEMVENISSQIRDHADQIQEVCVIVSRSS